MNVASLELCKELYELSGWKQDWFFWDGESGALWTRIQALNQDPHGIITIPAYDLGYVLRKLPVEIDNHILGCYRTEFGFVWSYIRRDDYGRWVFDSNHDKYSAGDVQSENALVKLAIKLHKQGILKHETA